MILTKVALRVHNLSYKIATIIAKKTEGDLHPKHRLMNYHEFFINNVDSEDIVLDVGCGNGALTFDLAKRAKKVIGIDLDKENIKIAKYKYSAPNIEYKVGDATRSLPNQKFSVIILSNVLEHIENRSNFLQKIKELSPKILIRVPMINRDWITLYKKELGLEWRLDTTHFTEYTLERLQEELNQVCLTIQNYSIQFGEIWACVSLK